jgi:hypothetical protein
MPPPGNGFETATETVEEAPPLVAGEICRWFPSMYVVPTGWPLTATVLWGLNPDPVIITCEEEPAVIALGESCFACGSGFVIVSCD